MTWNETKTMAKDRRGHSSLLFIVFGHLMPMMFLRHLFTKTWRDLMVEEVSLQVSVPYRRTDLTFLLKIRILVDVRRILLFQTGLRMENACNAFFFLACIDSIQINNTDLENISNFTYLGSIVSTTGGTDEDIQARKKKALQAFSILKPVWKSRILRTSTKIRIL
jgi:hypothetical protein